MASKYLHSQDNKPSLTVLRSTSWTKFTWNLEDAESRLIIWEFSGHLFFKRAEKGADFIVGAMASGIHVLVHAPEISARKIFEVK